MRDYIGADHDMPSSNDVAVALGRTPAVDVYAVASPSYNLFVDEVVTSLEMAGESAILHVLNSSTELLTKFASSADDKKRDPIEYFMSNMWKRDKEKWDTVIRAIWENVARGQQVAVFSDLDVQLYPGWAEMVRGCTDVALFCFGQSIGYFPTRTRVINSGFIALSTTSRTLQIALDFVAEYEKQWMRGDSRDFLEQEVLSQYMFENQRNIPFAFFNPELLQNSQAKAPLKLRVMHVVHSSNSRPQKLAAMRIGRNLYYAIYRLCLPRGEQGPEHPCCDLAMHTKSVYETRYLDYPPLLVGTYFGYAPPLNRSIRTRMSVLQHHFWSESCRLPEQIALDLSFSLRDKAAS
eukprot:TRINITY_DN27427_c0_g1_i1.p1 TRINITY_DN27427_c0_g1~~TRINITY_DN27427_c0_g1_i1.p1  ORF type:complete len:350 (-),score=44.30 TRINITY_DN27427_c0_g1_i1:591-1640(-)